MKNRIMKLSIFALLLNGALSDNFVYAQDVGLADPETDRLEREKKRLELEVDISTAKKTLRENEADRRTELSDALPTFEGKTTLNDGALDIESHLLAMTAVRKAALAIKGSLTQGQQESGTLIIAPNNDVLSEWQAVLLIEEMKDYTNQLKRARKAVQPDKIADEYALDPLTILSVAKGIGGLLRTETTISPLLLGSIDDQFMASALKAEMPKAKFSSLNSLVGDLRENPVFTVHRQLRFELDAAKDIIANAEKFKKKNEQLRVLKSLVTRVESLIASIVTEENKNAPSILIRAAMTKKLLTKDAELLRIKVIKAGGTAVQLDNIGVYFGDDPLRVSAGLIVGWTLENTEGNNWAGYIFCWTAAKSLRRVQSGKWLKKTFDNEDFGSQCRSAGNLNVGE